MPCPGWFWWTLGTLSRRWCCFTRCSTGNATKSYKLLLASFFPLAFLILAVLGTIVFGLATDEAAAVGSIGGFVLAAAFLAIARPAAERTKILRLWLPLWAVVLAAVVWFALLKSEFIVSPVPMWLGWLSMTAFVVWCAVATVQASCRGLSESVFLTAKTSAMVCWLFVASSISRLRSRCSAAGSDRKWVLAT